MKNFEKGKVKVVWIKDDPQRIYSKMFEDEKEALRFSRTVDDYIIFSLIDQKNMEEFEWKLLPFGHYKLYLKTVQIFQNNRGGITNFVEGIL